MSSITVKRADDLPYGPGQSDYEYDEGRQRKLEAEADARLCINCRHYSKRDFAPERGRRQVRAGGARVRGEGAGMREHDSFRVIPQDLAGVLIYALTVAVLIFGVGVDVARFVGRFL